MQPINYFRKFNIFMHECVAQYPVDLVGRQAAVLATVEKAVLSHEKIESDSCAGGRLFSQIQLLRGARRAFDFQFAALTSLLLPRFDMRLKLSVQPWIKHDVQLL